MSSGAVATQACKQRAEPLPRRMGLNVPLNLQTMPQGGFDFQVPSVKCYRLTTLIE